MAEDEKAKLYREIVQRADEQRVLERMRLHGFWPPGMPLPKEPPEEARERAQVEAEMAQLRKTYSSVKDPDRALAQERERRWKESKQRRAQARKEKAAEARRRHDAWVRRKSANVVHAGESVSGGLDRSQSDVAALHGRGLPVVHTGADIAAAMKIPLGTLRWLTYHRKSATVVHYLRYEIAKKTGG